MPWRPIATEDMDTALPLARLVHRNRRSTIRPLETGRGKWAHTPGPKTCVDSTGYIRDHHSYSVERRRGVECLWCGRRWGGKSDKEREP